LAPTLKKATKEMLGTCVSLGVTVEGKDPREVQKDIDDGNYEELFGNE
jgi:large subunit ribosomal protein L11